MNVTDEMVEAALGEFLLVEDRMYDRDDAPSARYVTEVALMAAIRVALAAAPTVYDEVAAERQHAHAKHGASGRSCEQLTYDHPLWLPILTEEVGEVAKALCDDEPLEDLRAELVQVAAMATAWAEAIDSAL